jgi:hypothetical protein
LEQQGLGITETGPFGDIPYSGDREGVSTYHGLLRRVYLGFSLLFLLGTIATLIIAITSA